MSVFRLPDLGEGLQEAEIVAWSVGPGDHVVAEQPLLSVETDKAVVEIPSPRAGRIAKLHGKPGDIVPIGAPLVEFEGGESADTGTVVGELETGTPKTAPPRPPAASAVRTAGGACAAPPGPGAGRRSRHGAADRARGHDDPRRHRGRGRSARRAAQAGGSSRCAGCGARWPAT